MDGGELMDWFYLTCDYLLILFIYLFKENILKKIIEEMCIASFHQLWLIGWGRAKVTVTIDGWMCTVSLNSHAVGYVIWDWPDQIFYL